MFEFSIFKEDKKDSLNKMLKKGFLGLIETLLQVHSPSILKEIKTKNERTVKNSEIPTKEEQELKFHHLYTSISNYQQIHSVAQFIMLNIFNCISNLRPFYSTEKNKQFYVFIKKFKSYLDFDYHHPQLQFVAKYTKSLYSNEKSPSVSDDLNLIKGEIKILSETINLGEKKTLQNIHFYRNDHPSNSVLSSSFEISNGKHYFEIYLYTGGKMSKKKIFFFLFFFIFIFKRFGNSKNK